MAANKTPRQDRKLLYVAPVIIAAIVIVIWVLALFRQPVATPEAVHVEVKKTSSAVASSLSAPEPVPVLTRADLIREARDAADEFTVAGKIPVGADRLVGRRFSVRIPFGCGGVRGGYGPAQMAMTYNVSSQSISLTASPGVWNTLPLMDEIINGSDIESVEGFWIPRPWTYTDSCPAQTDYPVPPTPTPPTGQTLGLAQLFEAGSSRVPRRTEHPYAFVRKLQTGDAEVLSHSYRLVLEGEISRYSRGNPLKCWIEAPDHQPICIYAVVFNHVAFEDAATGEMLASWNE